MDHEIPTNIRIGMDLLSIPGIKMTLTSSRVEVSGDEQMITQANIHQ